MENLMRLQADRPDFQQHFRGGLTLSISTSLRRAVVGTKRCWRLLGMAVSPRGWSWQPSRALLLRLPTCASSEPGWPGHLLPVPVWSGRWWEASPDFLILTVMKSSKPRLVPQSTYLAPESVTRPGSSLFFRKPAAPLCPVRSWKPGTLLQWVPAAPPESTAASHRRARLAQGLTDRLHSMQHRWWQAGSSARSSVSSDATGTHRI